MTSYALVESLPYSPAEHTFQNSVHPMAVQQVPLDKSYGYEALTHGHQPSNNSGYFNMQTGYGNNQLGIGYDSACARSSSSRNILGVVTYPKNCGCTQYLSRNCTGQFKPQSCSGSAQHGSCPKSKPVCCHPGLECGERVIGDSGTCINGVQRNR